MHCQARADHDLPTRHRFIDHEAYQLRSSRVRVEPLDGQPSQTSIPGHVTGEALQILDVHIPDGTIEVGGERQHTQAQARLGTARV
eukprot:CAMPEP_0177398416 /NCGR_PEP_ID=MMETSP0368-20130122/57889_1 /TAXON_ID=447022 ORGANISM="Scrippsiella hangoei-like, Strain SHHI-4" /NCGR_SAMPLE_ID=MMETSP0368 /ASSEMBLY_ACC=CAM_ASM_000363 /LENGTH=85 /DNA_ID=CAMNT_0018865497 /DNA_START=556 /DNA_END=810 /DNA_ORIENTATION=+